MTACTRVVACITLVLAALALPSAASASHRQAQIIAGGASEAADPATSLEQFRALGATTVRVFLHWYDVAPDPAAKRIPSHFDGSDPSAYPAAGWERFDALVRDARADGLRVDLTVGGGAPRWAQSGRIPPQGLADHSFAWQPDARLFGQFVTAAARRYSGTFTPHGETTPLPRVGYWVLWNEPNFGQDLGPQAIDGSRVSVAPMMYRALVDAGWSALHRTGHGADTIVIGGFAAEGRSGPVNRRHPQGLPGDYAQTKPLQFIHTLYCLDTQDRPLRGAYARARGCPTNTAGTRAFRSRHPGLFGATGVADHPYSGGRSPIDAQGLDRDFATFPQLGALERTIDAVQRAYGSRRRLPIYSDEFGYLTHPPQIATYASPAKAAMYLNWSEYISWRSPRIASYAQYLLADPPPAAHAGFTSGLLTSRNRPKATFAAYRLPIFLPQTTARRGQTVEVWGNARPAPAEAAATRRAQGVAIQFQRGGHGAWTTVRTIAVPRATGYFDTRVAFPASGKVRLAYTYPADDPLLPDRLAGTRVSGATVASRVVRLTLR